jgi:hypothetical protein
MKKILVILALCGLCIMSQSQRAAAACQNVAGYGAVSAAVPVLPSAGSYTIWTRMQAADATHNRYQLEVDGQDCFEVGGSSLEPGQWQWVSFQDGDLDAKVRYNFEHTSDNVLKLIGSDAGVKIDRLLLIKNDCVPVDIGNNCQSGAVALNSGDLIGADEIPPPSEGPVSGLIVPSQTISLHPNNISRVVYFVDSKQIPTAAGNALDTTLLTNGSHRVAIQITLVNGGVSNETTTLNVENKQTIFSPFRRLVRLNQHTTVVLSSILGGVLVLITILLIIRHVRLQRRLLNFHGF